VLRPDRTTVLAPQNCGFRGDRVSRGIISIVWGDEAKLPLERLRRSIEKYHPELPYRVIRVEASSDAFRSLNHKANMCALSPFEETLFLDADTVVMSRLDYGFERAHFHGMALAICECPWARRYQEIFDSDEVEYNTGVIFFTRKAEAVFTEWSALVQTVDSSIRFVKSDGQPAVMPANDQGSFALAIENTMFNPFVLPLNWNFRPRWHRSFFGPIKIWHDYSDPTPALEEMNSYYASENHVIQYHTI
jgi:hypothetical protein